MRSVLLTFLLLCPFVAHGQTSGVPDPQAYMKAYMAATQPGEEHAFLSRFAGTWSYKNTMFMPGVDPTLSTGETKMVMVVGERYLSAVHIGTISGEPFEGRALTAFDRTANEFVTTWVDNVGLGILVFRGARNAEGALVQTATYVDPVTGEPQTHRMVQQLLGPSEMIMTYHIWSLADEPYRAMEVTYIRKQ